MSNSEKRALGGHAAIIPGMPTGGPVLERIAPILFGLFVLVVIWQTAWSPPRTLPTLAWCLICLSVLLLVALHIQGRRVTVPRDVRLLLFALAASLTASNILLSSLSMSLPRLGLYGSLALLALGIYVMYRDAGHLPLRAYCIAIALVHIPFLVEILLWVARSEPPFYLNGVPRVPHFVHVRHFGYLGFLAAASGTALAALSPRKGWLWFLMAGAALFGMIATGSRGAVLAWVAFVLLLTGIGPARRRVALHGLAALVTASVAVSFLHYSGLLTSPNIFVRLQALGTGGGPDYDSGRLEMWRASLDVIARHPWFGLGTEAYQISGCCNRTVAQPHNFVLQLLMQFGLVGTALLAALVWRAVRSLGGLRGTARLVLATAENRVLAAMLAAYLAFGLIDGLLYREIPLIHFALLCGLFAAGLRRTHDTRQASR